MSDEEDEITKLIQELKDLKIREAQVLLRLERAHQKNKNQERCEETSTDSTTPSARENEDNTRGYKKGDRIVITNRVKKPVNWKGEWTATKERHATVTISTTEKVFFKTDNGVFTWRAPKNIVHQQTTR